MQLVGEKFVSVLAEMSCRCRCRCLCTHVCIDILVCVCVTGLLAFFVSRYSVSFVCVLFSSVMCSCV